MPKLQQALLEMKSSLTLNFDDAFTDFVDKDLIADHAETYDWESNWDDEEQEDAFSKQLRAEISKLKK